MMTIKYVQVAKPLVPEQGRHAGAPQPTCFMSMFAWSLQLHLHFQPQ